MSYYTLNSPGHEWEKALHAPTPAGTGPLSRSVETAVTEEDWSLICSIARLGDTTPQDILRGMIHAECRVARHAATDLVDLYKHDPIAEALTGDGR